MNGLTVVDAAITISAPTSRIAARIGISQNFFRFFR